MRKIIAELFSSLDGVVSAPQHRHGPTSTRRWAVAPSSSSPLTAEQVTELKQAPGGDIVVTGSVALVQALIRHGALDQLRLITDPVLLGEGTRLFDGAAPAALRLVDTHTSATGALSATYAVG
ncbi:dihydrofolate reductase family protein [Pseudonocardia sp. GCM10023141]|uniref:dihydrofolate reductase family protein n=1 Tax=Pseudonocardia sp. GCM10023141 TaxID=3252653 RepID=UPI00360798AC